MEGHCSTGQSPQWAVVPMQEEEEEEDDELIQLTLLMMNTWLLETCRELE